MTELIHQVDSYAREMPATVLAVEGQGVVLDRTAFYPQGGGQPGDAGVLTTADGREIPVVSTAYRLDRSAVTAWRWPAPATGPRAAWGDPRRAASRMFRGTEGAAQSGDESRL